MATSTNDRQSKPKPKGILKQPSTFPQPQPQPSSSPPPPPPPPPAAELTRAERLARQEAAARLRLLQKLRETEVKPPVPIETFELLSQEFPRHPDRAASSPHPGDVAELLPLLADFTPQEYLDLIEERNCLGRCGYALCARPRRTHDGPYKINTRVGSVARTEDLNKWCSDACAKRALYIKVQLDNPSYVRNDQGRMVVKLDLRDEGAGGGGGGGGGGGRSSAAASPRGKEEDRDQLAQAMAQLEIDRHKQAKKDATALAGERGDATDGLLAGMTRVDVTISERVVDGPHEAPSSVEGTESMIEGYKPKNGTDTGKKPGEGADSDDDDDFFTVRF
ncbi:Rtr1/RPAP2 family-domain-containing protein [Thermothelomyces heterothallicus CBS 202.75]|uniref:Rtr1/RPAP2 family-domain-containing protein n=1 Tax=Thermothelomyces heterothallicus CBS 202.75 TaxID=1149848 RepID=UPI003743BC68